MFVSKENYFVGHWFWRVLHNKRRIGLHFVSNRWLITSNEVVAYAIRICVFVPCATKIVLETTALFAHRADDNKWWRNVKFGFDFISAELRFIKHVIFHIRVQVRQMVLAKKFYDKSNILHMIFNHTRFVGHKKVLVFHNCNLLFTEHLLLFLKYVLVFYADSKFHKKLLSVQASSKIK